ncbi:MAG TPA: putative metal-binding motif-containing protein [Solirubrobacterales bacterium]
MAFALGAIVACLTATGAAGAAPINDDFADRLPIQLGVADTRSNVGATIEAGERLTANDPDGFGCNKQGEAAAGDFQMDGTMWWEFTGNGGPITVSTLASNFDTVLGVYEIEGGAMVACNDDLQPLDPTRPTLQFRVSSEVLLESVAGRHYAVQVGGCIPAEKCWDKTSGNVTLRVSQTPVNDDRSAAESIVAGVPVAMTNTGATLESGEMMTCDTGEVQGVHQYGKTVWFRYVAPRVGTAAFSAAGFDTVIAVYRDSASMPLGCNDDAVEGQFGASRFPKLLPPEPLLEVTPGEYLIQVGGFFDDGFSPVAARNGPLSVQVEFIPDLDLDDDGINTERDCNDQNAAIRPGAEEIWNNDIDENCDGFPVYDRDHDGVSAPPLGTDCRDDDAGINPRTGEVPGNRVDENCDTQTPDYPRMLIRIGIVEKQYKKPEPYSWIPAVSLVEVPAGAQVEVRCLGADCPKMLVKRFQVKEKRGSLELPAGFRLAPGERVDIRVTKPETIGREQVFKIRAGKKPVPGTYCLDPVGHRRPC